jgi:hypothetical protein
MNWFAVAVFIEAPNPNAPGSFEYVKASGKMGRDMFTPSSAGLMAFYDRIAFQLKDVPETLQAWTFIACSLRPRRDSEARCEWQAIMSSQ